MENYDPEWTAVEAFEAETKERARRSLDVTDSLPPHQSPFARWSAHHQLLSLEMSFNEGEKFSLLQAVSVCAIHDLVLPEWLSHAYLRAYRKVQRDFAKSWDDAFGRPYPKGTNTEALKKRRNLRHRVYELVRIIRSQEPNTPIDEALFERVGKHFNIGKTLTSEYYYEVKNWAAPKLPENSKKLRKD